MLVQSILFDLVVVVLIDCDIATTHSIGIGCDVSVEGVFIS